MSELDQLAGASTMAILMWVAVGLSLAFLALLVGDHIKRKRNRNRYRRRAGGLGRSLTRPFRRAAGFWDALSELRRQRARRREWEAPQHSRRGKERHQTQSRRRYGTEGAASSGPASPLLPGQR